MKYIKTKDGIYEWVDYDNECIIPMPIIKYEGRLTHCAECDIIKQADTIGELCDVIVSVKKHEGTVVEFDILWSFLNWREELGEEIAEGAEIYGAIWTDKGLIYVAKMKGILTNGEIDWVLL